MLSIILVFIHIAVIYFAFKYTRKNKNTLFTKCTAEKMLDISIFCTIYFAYFLFSMLILIASLHQNKVSQLLWQRGLLSGEECAGVIEAAESHAAKHNGWY